MKLPASAEPKCTDDVSRAGRISDVTVHVCEEHSSVLPEWWRRRVRARTLICLDAHLDLLQVGRERMRRLDECTTWEQFKQLEKPHRMLADAPYSFSIEDFLYPAHRLGLIDRLVWVIPPHVYAGYSPTTFRQLEQINGVEFEELLSFRRADKGWVEGRLLGLPIVVCSYQDLQRMQLPADSLIDIDTDYFVTVPGDTPWIDPKTVVEFLQCLFTPPDPVTISRSVDSGYTPLRYRFFADYLAALWQKRDGESAHYARLFHWDCLLREGQREAVASLCEAELRTFSQCPATWYLLSLAQQNEHDAKPFQLRAAQLSRGYQPTPLRSALGIHNRQQTVSANQVIALERQLPQTSQVEQALTLTALGVVYVDLGQIDRAVAAYQRAGQHLSAQPELALRLGRSLAKERRTEEAVFLLHQALQNDATRAKAHAHLAQIFMSFGSFDVALTHLETARGLTPAWGQILSMLTTVHQQLGNQQQARSARRQYQQQRLQTQQLADRFL